MPLNVPLDQVLIQIKDDPFLKWLEKMKGDLNSGIRTNIAASIEIMGMTQTSIMT